jgi:CheY-like chemotaxis protein
VGPDSPFTIVLADDDEDDRLLVLEALREAEFQDDLRTVGDGVDLLDYLRKADDRDAPRPGLILLDLNMPRMSGHEALTAIKQAPGLRSIPVVILTTSRYEEDITRSYDLGCNSYITKPKDFSELVDVMKGFSRYWLETVSLPPPG